MLSYQVQYLKNIGPAAKHSDRLILIFGPSAVSVVLWKDSLAFPVPVYGTVNGMKAMNIRKYISSRYKVGHFAENKVILWIVWTQGHPEYCDLQFVWKSNVMVNILFTIQISCRIALAKPKKYTQNLFCKISPPPQKKKSVLMLSCFFLSLGKH